jgi:hypothetical protein
LNSLDSYEHTKGRAQCRQEELATKLSTKVHNQTPAAAAAAPAKEVIDLTASRDRVRGMAVLQTCVQTKVMSIGNDVHAQQCVLDSLHREVVHALETAGRYCPTEDKSNIHWVRVYDLYKEQKEAKAKMKHLQECAKQQKTRAFVCLDEFIDESANKRVKVKVEPTGDLSPIAVSQLFGSEGTSSAAAAAVNSSPEY